MSVKQSLEQIIDNLQGTLKDADKTDRGNKSAGVRVRKAAQEATTDLKALRQQVLDVRNAQR